MQLVDNRAALADKENEGVHSPLCVAILAVFPLRLPVSVPRVLDALGALHAPIPYAPRDANQLQNVLRPTVRFLSRGFPYLFAANRQ